MTEDLSATDLPHAAENPGPGDRWLALLAGGSRERFDATVAADVVVEASILLGSIAGRDTAWACLRVLDRVYDRHRVTFSAVAGDRSYVEWTATALGQEMAGVTVLVVDDSARLVLLAIHHRPLAAALSLSIAVRTSLTTPPDPTFFYRGSGREP